MDITEQRLYMNDHKVEYNEYGIMGHVTWSLDNLSSTAFATACWRTGYSFWQTSTHCLVPCREWKPLLSFHFSLRNFELIGKIQVQISGYLRTIWQLKINMLDKPKYCVLVYSFFPKWIKAQGKIKYHMLLVPWFWLNGKSFTWYEELD